MACAETRAMLDPVFPGVGQRSVARQSPGGGMWATVGRYGRLGHAGFADKSSPQRYVTEQLDVVDAVRTRPVCCDPDTCTCPRRISDTCRTRQIFKAKKSAGANLLTLDLLGSSTWARTRDLRINSPALYQLSYRGISLRLYTQKWSKKCVRMPFWRSPAVATQ